jgi:hypothetical protein
MVIQMKEDKMTKEDYLGLVDDLGSKMTGISQEYPISVICGALTQLAALCITSADDPRDLYQRVMKGFQAIENEFLWKKKD